MGEERTTSSCAGDDSAREMRCLETQSGRISEISKLCKYFPAADGWVWTAESGKALRFELPQSLTNAMDIALKPHGRTSSASAKASVGIRAITLTVFACTCVIFALSNNAQASPTTVEQSA
jgi:hypothetical protein